MVIDAQTARVGDGSQAEKSARNETDNLHNGKFMGGDDALSLARGKANGNGSDGANSALPQVTFLKEQTDKTKWQQQVNDTAGKLADFISQTKDNGTLDIAIYHFQLSGDGKDKVVNALNERAEHGVNIRLGVFEDTKGKKASDDDEGDEPAVNSNVVGDLDKNIQVEGITASGHLMHSKYIVHDGDTAAAAVWTGSTNFTDDAFGSQDNNIITLQSKDLAKVYEEDFQQMWDAHNIKGAGKDLHSTVNIGGSDVTVAFSPGDGKFIEQELAQRIEEAKKSVHIASMDITSGPVLKALSDKIDQGIPVTGMYDGPQMNTVAKAWARSKSEQSAENLETWNKVKEHLVGKQSHPFHAGALSDFMHNKALSVDDSVVITGSFNFSTNATHNAENIVEIANPQLAKQYANYIDDLVVTYGKKN